MTDEVEPVITLDLSTLDIQTVGRLELTDDTLLIFAAPDSYPPSRINAFHIGLEAMWRRLGLKGSAIVVPHGTVLVGVAQEATHSG